MAPLEQFKDLLKRVRLFIPDDEFCGVGIVLYASLTDLPIRDLCFSAGLPKACDLAEQVALCCLESSSCHDGFQFVSTDWTLTKRNQYFAPYSQHVFREMNGNVGSRYMAAKLGSLMDSVVCTGVLGDRDGLLVFVNGVAVD